MQVQASEQIFFEFPNFSETFLDILQMIFVALITDRSECHWHIMHELMVFYYVSSVVCPVVVPTYLPTYLRRLAMSWRMTMPHVGTLSQILTPLLWRKYWQHFGRFRTTTTMMVMAMAMHFRLHKLSDIVWCCCPTRRRRRRSEIMTFCNKHFPMQLWQDGDDVGRMTHRKTVRCSMSTE